MMKSDKGKTTRYELEVSVGWALEHPELFTTAFAEFSETAIQHDLFDISVDIDRVGFWTFTATKGDES